MRVWDDEPTRYQDSSIRLRLDMPHLGHAHATNTLTNGRRRTDRQPLRRGGVGRRSRLLAFLRRPLTPTSSPATAGEYRDVRARPVMQIAQPQQSGSPQPQLQLHSLLNEHLGSGLDTGHLVRE